MWTNAIEVLEEQQKMLEQKMSKHHCDYCDRVLLVGEEVIKDHGDMYCMDCITEDSITYYSLDGEYLGDENTLGFGIIAE